MGSVHGKLYSCIVLILLPFWRFAHKVANWVHGSWGYWWQYLLTFCTAFHNNRLMCSTWCCIWKYFELHLEISGCKSKACLRSWLWYLLCLQAQGKPETPFAHLLNENATFYITSLIRIVKWDKVFYKVKGKTEELKITIVYWGCQNHETRNICMHPLSYSFPQNTGRQTHNFFHILSFSGFTTIS